MAITTGMTPKRNLLFCCCPTEPITSPCSVRASQHNSTSQSISAHRWPRNTTTPVIHREGVTQRGKRKKAYRCEELKQCSCTLSDVGQSGREITSPCRERWLCSICVLAPSAKAVWLRWEAEACALPLGDVCKPPLFCCQWGPQRGDSPAGGRYTESPSIQSLLSCCQSMQ